MMASSVRNVGQTNISLVYGQNLDKTFSHCALNENKSSDYSDNINTYSKFIKIPFILIYMVISKRVNILNFLLIALIATVITGYMMAVYVHEAG